MDKGVGNKTAFKGGEDRELRAMSRKLQGIG